MANINDIPSSRIVAGGNAFYPDGRPILERAREGGDLQKPVVARNKLKFLLDPEYAEPCYVTGTGQVMSGLHPETADCQRYGCVIHNPTDPHQDWPTHWRGDRQLMERICVHGVGHPDRNAIEFIRRTRGDERAKTEAVHGCDGCCR